MPKQLMTYEATSSERLSVTDTLLNLPSIKREINGQLVIQKRVVIQKMHKETGDHPRQGDHRSIAPPMALCMGC